MRIAAIIFLSLLTFLTIQPLFSSVNHTARKKCCMKMETGCNKNKESDNRPLKCDAGKCNPFMACAAGNFYIVAKSYAEHHLAILFNKIVLPQNDHRLASSSSDCWHPPENI